MTSLGVTLRLYTRRACPGKWHLYYQRATIITSDGRRTRGFIGCPVSVGGPKASRSLAAAAVAVATLLLGA